MGFSLAGNDVIISPAPYSLQHASNRVFVCVGVCVCVCVCVCVFSCVCSPACLYDSTVFVHVHGFSPVCHDFVAFRLRWMDTHVSQT